MASAKVESLTVCCCSSQQEPKQDLHPTVRDRDNYLNSHNVTALHFRKNEQDNTCNAVMSMWCQKIIDVRGGALILPRPLTCRWQTKKSRPLEGKHVWFLDNVNEIFKHHSKKNKSFKTVPLSKGLTKCPYIILLLGKLVGRNVLHRAELWKKNFIQQSTNIYTNNKKKKTCALTFPLKLL